MVSVKVKYLNKDHPKIHYINLSFIKRSFDEHTQLVYEYVYYTVKAWIGDNNTVHLMSPLPDETEVTVDLEVLFSVTPDQEDIDETSRALIIGELFESQDQEDF